MPYAPGKTIATLPTSTEIRPPTARFRADGPPGKDAQYEIRRYGNQNGLLAGAAGGRRPADPVALSGPLRSANAGAIGAFGGARSGGQTGGFGRAQYPRMDRRQAGSPAGVRRIRRHRRVHGPRTARLHRRPQEPG